MTAVLITSDPNGGSDTIVYDAMSWRQVVPGEDQQLVDLGLAKPVRVVDPQTMTRIRTTLPEVGAAAPVGGAPAPSYTINLTGTAEAH